MKAATRKIQIQGIEIEVPAGSMDRPDAKSEAIMKAHQDPRGWKYPVRAWATSSKKQAQDYAYCLNWYMGGHEMTLDHAPDCTLYIVTSKGYYHYIGA